MSKKPELRVAGSTTSVPTDKPVQAVVEFDISKDLSRDNEDKQMAGQVPSPAPAPITRLNDMDRLALEVAKANRRAALAQAKQAMAENETSEGAYKYFVLQLYMKYGLTERDAISEQGEIMRGHGDILRTQSVPVKK